MRAAALALALLLAAAPAAAQEIAIPDRPAPTSPAEITERAEALYRHLTETQGTFQLDQAMREVMTLRGALFAQSGMKAEWRMVIASLGMVVAKSQSLSRDLGIQAMQEALAIDVPHSPASEAYDRYFYGGLLSDVRRHDLALEQYREALHLAAVAGIAADTTLYMRMKVGFVLGELGRIDDAMAENRAALAEAEAAWGPDDPRLCTFVANLAAGDEKRDDPAAAEVALARAEPLCDEPGLKQSLIFRRAVIALNAGRGEDAVAHSARRLALLRPLGNEELLAQAEFDDAEIRRKAAQLAASGQ